MLLIDQEKFQVTKQVRVRVHVAAEQSEAPSLEV